MKKAIVLAAILYSLIYSLDCKVTPREYCGPPNSNYYRNYTPSPNAVRIDWGFDIRSIMGTAGKNICADTTQKNVAVQYGEGGLGESQNYTRCKIAYSTNGGNGWQLFGPFHIQYPSYRRLYGGIDARATNWYNNEIIYASWHEAYYRSVYVDSSPLAVAFDEGNFPNGSFRLAAMPHSGDPGHNIWLTCIAVRPDDANIVIASGGDYDFGAGGPKDIFTWKSTDGGYTWSPPQLLIPGSTTIGLHDAPHIRFGTGGYVFAYFQQETIYGFDTLMWPYCIESTDNGQTWVPPNGRCMFTAIPCPQWSSGWYNYDCEVVNNVPYVVISPGVPGQHRDRTEFWKASGPVGDRTWTMTLLGGSSPPGQDSLVRDVSIVTGKDYARFAENIAIISKVTNQSGTSPRCWVSNDLGASWRYLGNLNIPLAAADNPLECAHVPGRGTNPVTDVWLHFVYWSTGSVYYEGVNLTGVAIEEVIGQGTALPEILVMPNPARGQVRLAVDSDGLRPGLIRIFDVTGKLVKQAVLRLSGFGTIDISSLSPGMYFVEIGKGQKKQTKKLVVVR